MEFSKFDHPCDCEKQYKGLEVETNKAIYEIEFGQIQIEITGRCNMQCLHCRAASEIGLDMPLKQIVKIMKFARQFSPDYKEVVISGGEPTLHRDFIEVLRAVRMHGGKSLTLTTNGLRFTEEYLLAIQVLNFSRVILSVSLDSIVPEEHNAFRKCPTAYDGALKALKMIVAAEIPNVIASIRSTLKPSQIQVMEDMVIFAKELGCQRISFSAIHPVGRAFDCPSFWMSPFEKKRFIEEVIRLRQKYSDTIIDTNDPLKCLLRDHYDVGDKDEIVFDGCGAGAITFNVRANGDMTPCALHVH